MAIRDAAGTPIADWRERGRDLGFGAGIAQGYATLGQIGFSERSGSQRVNAALKGSVATEQIGALALKGPPIMCRSQVAQRLCVSSREAYRVFEKMATSRRLVLAR